MTAFAWSPRDLLLRWRNGEAAAREAVVREAAGRLLGLAQQLLGDGELALAALRQGLQAAFAACERTPADLRGFLLQHVAAAAVSRLPVDAAADEQAMAALLPTFTADGHRQGAEEPAPEGLTRWLASAAGRSRLRRSIQQLPPSHRAVLVLRDVEGVGEPAAKALLGCDLRALRSRLRSARLALHELVVKDLATGAATAC